MLLKEQIKTVARGLQPLAEEFVFVGGAVAGCYATVQGAEEARPTDDIDVVLELAHYGQYAFLQERLSDLGFNPDSTSRVICRYRFNGIKVDIMPDNPNILGFSNRWYKDGIKQSILFDLDDVHIKIFSAPLYLATKIEAYRHRGSSDKRLSSDFEDIIYVLENRPEIVDEIKTSDADISHYIMEFAALLLKERDTNEGIRSVLGYVPLPGRVAYVTDILQQISQLTP